LDEEEFLKTKPEPMIKQELEDKLKAMDKNKSWAVDTIEPDLLDAQRREVKKCQKNAEQMRKWILECREYYRKREDLSIEEMDLGDYIQSKRDFEEKLKRGKMEYRSNKIKTKGKRVIIRTRRKTASWIARHREIQSNLKRKELLENGEKN
jgi:hypothetical protein